MSETPKPGIYPGVPWDEYCSWDAVNNTLLHTLDSQSPAHAKEYMDNPPEPSDAFRQGQQFHVFTLEPLDFDNRYIIAPKVDRRTKDGKAAWEEFEQQLDGREAISEDDYNVCVAMCNALQHHKAAWRLLCSGEAEVCVVWIDADTGILCKARLDYLHREYGVIVDVKTARDARPDAFSRALWTYGYFQQAAFYTDGVGTILRTRPEFNWLAVEKQPPYAVAAYRASTRVMELGVRAYKRALQTYKRCVKTGVWPAYSEHIELITVPRWAQDPDEQAERYSL